VRNPDRDKALELLKAGASITKIAGELGISRAPTRTG
jgi:hypothetical protein